MKPFNIIYSGRDDHYIAQLRQLSQGLKELGEIMDRYNQQRPYVSPQVVTRRIVVERKVAQPTPVLIFPFSVLAYLIDRATTKLDQVVARFVQTVMARWVHGIQRFLRPKKRP